MMSQPHQSRRSESDSCNQRLWMHSAAAAAFVATAAAASAAESSTATVAAAAPAATPFAASSSSSSSTAAAATTDAKFSFSARDTDLSVPLPSLKYPIVLVHGYLGYASLLRTPSGRDLLTSPVDGEPLLEYFGSVRRHLRKASDQGITVITPVNPPAASIAIRARKLRLALGLQSNKEKREAEAATGISGGGGDGDGVTESSLGTDHSQRTISASREAQSAASSHPPSGFSDDAPSQAEQATTSKVEFRNTAGDEGAGSGPSASSSSSEGGTSIILGGASINLDSYEGKFHLIAHSMGGLDCRYLIASLDRRGAYESDPQLARKRIASLTTIGSPHRGSPIADMVLDVIDVPLTFRSGSDHLASAWTWNKISQWIGAAVGVDVGGISNLSTEQMAGFNERVRDVEGVTYQSYAGYRRFKRISPWYLPAKWIARFGARHDHSDPASLCGPRGVYCAGGPNDGLVSVGSARWGRFAGVAPLDHLEQIGLGMLGDKHLPLYRQIVFGLKELEEREERQAADAIEAAEQRRQMEQPWQP